MDLFRHALHMAATIPARSTASTAMPQCVKHAMLTATQDCRRVTTTPALLIAKATSVRSMPALKRAVCGRSFPLRSHARGQDATLPSTGAIRGQIMVASCEFLGKVRRLWTLRVVLRDLCRVLACPDTTFFVRKCRIQCVKCKRFLGNSWWGACLDLRRYFPVTMNKTRDIVSTWWLKQISAFNDQNVSLSSTCQALSALLEPVGQVRVLPLCLAPPVCMWMMAGDDVCRCRRGLAIVWTVHTSSARQTRDFEVSQRWQRSREYFSTVASPAISH